MWCNNSKRLTLIVLLAGNFLTTKTWARKGNEPVYQEAFDLAAGGASLTRATQEGIVYSNPALLPLGGAWLRWVGIQTAVITDQTSANALKAGDTPSSEELFERPFHLGQSLSLSLLSKNFAISIFERFEIDLEGQKIADGGLPTVQIDGEAYAGGVFSLASQPLPWLSFGLSTKYLMVSEPSIIVPLADLSYLMDLMQDPSALRDEVTPGEGMGHDLGALVFLQGRNLDFSFALKVDDVGDTQIKGKDDPFFQTVSVGFGLAIHSRAEVLHLALDYRDILDAYDDRPFKKIYLGARLLLRHRVGLAMGLYQGIPTAGFRLDLWICTLGFTAYGRELGNYPGERQRNLYHAYVAFGI